MQIEDFGTQDHPALPVLRIEDQDRDTVTLNEVEAEELRRYLNRRAGRRSANTADPDGVDLKLTVTRSAGLDDAVLVLVDTGFEPDASDGGPGLRVLVNDFDAYEGVSYQLVAADQEPREADRVTFEVTLAEIGYHEGGGS
jgi:hypothetical protein